jgi:hypothetical protein
MSHDIIVKQHGGSIDVETALGSLPSSGSYCRGPARNDYYIHPSMARAAHMGDMAGVA